jgi:hypothetical protein
MNVLHETVALKIWETLSSKQLRPVENARRVQPI